MNPYEGSADDELDNPSGSLFMLTTYQKKIIRNLIASTEARGARRITDAIHGIPQCCEDRDCHVSDVFEAADKELDEIVFTKPTP